MRLNLFWKLGLAYLALTLAVLLAVDLYTARTLRGDYLRAGFEQLDGLGRLAQARPPQLDDPGSLRAWVSWIARSGARVTVITADGRVLADSAHDPETMENHAGRPEIRQAFSSGEGRAIRRSATLDRDLVYLALLYQAPGEGRIVLRFALPVEHIDEALADFRRRLWTASLVILLVAGGISLAVSRSFSRRVERLKAFSQRVADGDFRPLGAEQASDELAELARALNENASRLDQTIHSLTDERNRSAAILRSMAEGVAVVSADGRVIFSNQAFCRTLALEAESCEGRPFIELIRQSDLLAMVETVLTQGQGVSREIEIGTARPRNLAVTGAPVRSDGTTGAVLVLHDISELRRLERVRRDFVASVSHELKTPLTAVQGFAETLLSGALEDQANSRRFLEIIRNHAVRLGRLTDDLLKLSQIEAGKLELEFRAVSVPEVVQPCVETSRLKASEKNLVLFVDCPAGLPALRGDGQRLQEVLQNLLDNAIQYTPPGGQISIHASRHGQEVVISVSDTGIGIPQAEHQRIFERFYRVDAARSREAGGTGLGLSIAKHLVEAHDGRIWVESAVGQGSTFHFSIPLAP